MREQYRHYEQEVHDSNQSKNPWHGCCLVKHYALSRLLCVVCACLGFFFLRNVSYNCFNAFATVGKVLPFQLQFFYKKKILFCRKEDRISEPSRLFNGMRLTLYSRDSLSSSLLSVGCWYRLKLLQVCMLFVLKVVHSLGELQFYHTTAQAQAEMVSVTDAAQWR